MSDNSNEKKDSEKKPESKEKEDIKLESNSNDNKNSELSVEKEESKDDLENLDIGQILQAQKKEEQDDKKYNMKNIDDGKQNFKDRYIQEKLEEISTTIQRLSFKKEENKETKIELRNSVPLPKNKTNFENYEKESERRKCETEFLLIVEKSIISFNLKKYQESYTYLENSGVIKNILEFGKFLLVVSGFDKGILGEF